MTRTAGWIAAVVLSIVAVAPGILHADTVQLSIRKGRVSLVATNATPAEIFTAWSKAGGVAVVNADRMPATPITIRLDDVPEEQALDTLLRPVSGYLAQRRVSPLAAEGSIFARIVILATPPQAAAPQPAVVPATPAGSTPGSRRSPLPAPQPQPEPPAASPPERTPEPQGIPVDTGVTRLTGPDGQPVDDDQVGAPPPSATPPGGADAPPPPSPGSATSSRPGMPTTPAAGVVAPGMPTAAPPARQR